jgi:hypothetical protein
MHEVKRLLETQPHCAKLNLEYLYQLNNLET